MPSLQKKFVFCSGSMTTRVRHGSGCRKRSVPFSYIKTSITFSCNCNTADGIGNHKAQKASISWLHVIEKVMRERCNKITQCLRYFKVEMGKYPQCLGSVLFEFCDYQGSVRFEFLASL